jgi:predicted  nucleic acid-binding Zn-ribbon protein
VVGGTIDDGFISFDFEEKESDIGEIEQYQCDGCGMVLGKTQNELIDFLKENKMVEFDDGDNVKEN